MPRLKRWVNMYEEKVDENGFLKEEYIQQLRSYGFDDDYIAKHGEGFKEDYEKLKLLDETDPEPWPIYTAYDFFTAEEKREFNPDGTLRPEYVEYARSIGISSGALEESERRKMIDVDNYNAVSAQHAERGINFGAQEMRSRIASSESYAQRRKQMQQDLRNFEDPDSLPFDKDTDY